MRTIRRVPILLAVVVLVAAAAVSAPAAAASTSVAVAKTRSFTCTGSAGEALTQRVVTGLLTVTGTPYRVAVSRPGTTAPDSLRPGKALLVGPSAMHPGYLDWNVTGANPGGDGYDLHLPPVLPGGGGFVDAELDIAFAGGANGGWQLLMYDCAISGGRASLSHPSGPRSFTCAGGLGEAFTNYSVSGGLTRHNQPVDVVVTEADTATVVSARSGASRLLGASWLHPGYQEWDVTGSNPDGYRYRLNVAPVLPPVGGYFDADLMVDMLDLGNLQIPMYDCVVG